MKTELAMSEKTTEIIRIGGNEEDYFAAQCSGVTGKR